MLLLALDLGARLGWCFGDANHHPPRIGAERLCPGETVQFRAGVLGTWLRDFMCAHGKPDKIIVEQFLAPTASFSGSATVGQLLLHGALHSVAGMGHIGVESVSISTSRKHFCGQSQALPSRGRAGGVRTSAEKNAARRATKEMVIERARMLGYLPVHDGTFEDLSAMADAACVYDWGKVYVARAAPTQWKMFASSERGIA